MTDEIQVAVLDTTRLVVVPLPDVSVLLAEEQVPLVVERAEETLVVDTVESHVVDEVEDLSVLTAGEVGPQGLSGGLETYTAGDNLGGHRVLVANSAGSVVYADNTDTTHADQAARISSQAAAIGDPIIVHVFGRITESSWAWTPGASLYVGTNGLMTMTPPASPAAFSKVIAVAETATRILMVNEAPVLLA